MRRLAPLTAAVAVAALIVAPAAEATHQPDGQCVSQEEFGNVNINPPDYYPYLAQVIDRWISPDTWQVALKWFSGGEMVRAALPTCRHGDGIYILHVFKGQNPQSNYAIFFKCLRHQDSDNPWNICPNAPNNPPGRTT